VHYEWDGTCDAFPWPSRIPAEILFGENDHAKPFPGDHGVQFELADDGQTYIDAYREKHKTKVAAHLPGQHDQMKHAGPYKSIDKMSYKEMKQELSEVHAYTGPTSYTKTKLATIVLEQRKKTDAALAKEKMTANDAPAAAPPKITDYADKSGNIPPSAVEKFNADLAAYNASTTPASLDGPWSQSATFKSMSVEEKTEYVKYAQAGGTAFPYQWKQGKDAGATSSSGVIKPKVSPAPASTSVGPNRGKSFSSYSQADAYGKTHWKESREALSAKDEQAIGRYLSHSGSLNAAYRSQQPMSKSNLETRNALDSFIERSPRVPEDILVYRGFGQGSHILEQPVGTQFVDNGFTSVALHHSVGKNFAGNGKGKFKGTTVVAEIKVSKGAKAGYISNLNGAHYKESEMVLPRGSQFKIVGSRPEGGYTIVELELES